MRPHAVEAAGVRPEVTGRQKRSLEVHGGRESAAEHGGGKIRVLAPRRGTEGGLERRQVPSVVPRLQLCDCDPPLTTPSLSVLPGSLGPHLPADPRLDLTPPTVPSSSGRSLRPQPPPPHLRAPTAGGNSQECLPSASPSKQTNQKGSQPKCLFGPLPDLPEALPDFFRARLCKT